MDSKDYITREDRYLAHNYHPLPVVLAKGDGIWLWDVDGNKYLDFLSASSAISAGHRNERIKKALIAQFEALDMPSRAFYTDKLGAFVEKLCRITGMDRVLPMNTGAEAVETAIKAARRWGYDVKGIPDNRAKIIVCNDNFHGRTTTICGFSSEPAYKRGFGPFDGGFDLIPFGDAAALEAAITPDTCAFLVETMQGEAGIKIPPKGWLKEVQAICRKHNVLLILDEIQCGMGRTGKNFAFQHEIDKPDGLLLGKSLGGGVYPVSAFLAREDVMAVFTPGSHGSTFGGNPLAAAIGLEALAILEEDALAARSMELGNHLKDELQSIDHKSILEIRGSGLWIGMDLDPALITARDFCEKLKEKGILCKETHDITVRFAPPLTISKDEIDWAVAQVRAVFGTLS